MRTLIPFLSFLLCYTVTYGQQIEIYKSSRLPAEPYGGSKEVQDLVHLQMNYPEKELENNISGEVFVTIKVDSDGQLISKTAPSEANTAFAKEALRLTDLILWKKNKLRESDKIGEEKIKFIFSKKKYSKVVRKRGYEEAKIASFKTYTLKQLDSMPKVLNYRDLNDFATKNIKYPSLALQQGISGNVKTTFVIEANGKISNIKINKAVAGGCNEETTRLLKQINWKPGIKDGEPVRTLYSYSLSFMHPGSTYR